jgi:hypothetical protein
MNEQQPTEDPNDTYTGWDLPEHPGLRAWIESLPPLCDEALYKVIMFSAEGHKSTYPLVMPLSDDQALEEFDVMFLAAHNGFYGQDIHNMSLWSPEREFRRRKIAEFDVSDPLV